MSHSPKAPGDPKWRAGSEAAAKQLDESWVVELAISTRP